MSVFGAAIGWLAPPDCVGCGREGASLCLSCSAAEILPYGERCYGCGAISPRARVCSRCRRGAPLRHVWAATDYTGLSKEILQVYKFAHRRSVAAQLTELLADCLKSYNSNADLAAANYLVVAVPTATTRVRERGFDHAQLLAKQLGNQLGLQTSKCLSRLGQSRQVGAKKGARMVQQAHSYYVRRPDVVSGRNVLLIDDVVTTGATLKAAAKVLRAAGAKRVDALVLAKRI